MKALAAAFLVMALGGAALAQIAAQDRKSGAQFMSPSTRAMQADDTSNPGMLAALDGEALWNAPGGEAKASCASCHGEAKSSMKGAAARYPAFHAASQRVIDLSSRINICRQENQKAPPLAHESREMLALTAYLGLQSRGEPVAPPDSADMRAAQQRGEELWRRRFGQLNFSCAQCHDDNWGRKLGSAPIPQAHPNAYPVYRLEWQGMGSLQRRFRNCMTGVRAEAFPFGAPEFVDLEAYLMKRAEGMALETPGVRP